MTDHMTQREADLQAQVEALTKERDQQGVVIKGLTGLCMNLTGERDELRMIVTDVKRHVEPCADGIGRFIKDRIMAFETSGPTPVHVECSDVRTPTEPEGDTASDNRCPTCHWPYAGSKDKGCVPGDCCYRPHAKGQP